MDYKYIEFGQRNIASSFLAPSNHFKTSPVNTQSNKPKTSTGIDKLEVQYPGLASRTARQV